MTKKSQWSIFWRFKNEALLAQHEKRPRSIYPQSKEEKRIYRQCNGMLTKRFKNIRKGRPLDYWTTI